MSTICNLFLDVGSDFSNVLTVAAPNGAPLNLSDCIAKSQMRKSYNSSTAFTFTVEIQNASSGQIKLTMTAEETEIIPPGRYLYDIEITHTPTGRKKRVVEGIITATPQITQI